MRIPFIEKILNKLTYRLKLVTAVIFYTGAVILVTFLQQSWEERIIKKIEIKIAGLHYLQNVNLLILNILEPNTQSAYPPALSLDFTIAELKKNLRSHGMTNFDVDSTINQLKIPVDIHVNHSAIAGTLTLLDELIIREFQIQYSLSNHEYLLSFLLTDLLMPLKNFLLSIYGTDLTLENKQEDYYGILDAMITLHYWIQSLQALDPFLYEELSKKILPYIQEKTLDELNADKVQTLLKQVVLFSLNSSNNLIDYLQVQSNSLSYWRNLTRGVFRLALAIIIVIYVVRLVRKPLDHLRHAAEQVSNWNLAVRIPVFAKDELSLVARQFNGMAGFFEKIIEDAREITYSLNQTSTSIQESTQEFEKGILQHEKEVHLIEDSSREISQTLARLTGYFQEVRQGAAKTFHGAEAGYAYIADMQQAMKQITKVSSEIFSPLISLEEQIPRINKMILSLVNVADESNLLSLNTSIWAAKTGPQAAGFAIIAQKISDLANQTASAVILMENCIKNIVGVLSKISDSIDKLKAKVNTHTQDEANLEWHLRDMIFHTQDQIQAFESIYESLLAQSARTKTLINTLMPLTDEARQSSKRAESLRHEMDYLHHMTHKLQILISRFSLSSDVQP